MAQQKIAESTAVATSEEKDVATIADMYGSDDVGSGFENADSTSFSIPFLRILQSGSPQCKKSEGDYIKGAEEGDLFNTVTSETSSGDEGKEVIPVAFNRRFIEWAPRSEGANFIAEYMPAEGVELQETCTRDKGKYILPNGNILSDTRNHYVLIVDGDDAYPALVTMSSSQLKRSKQWMSIMQQKTINIEGRKTRAPMYAYSYVLKTAPEANDQGSWFGWRICGSVPVSNPYFVKMSRVLRKGIADDRVDVDMAAAA